MDVNILIVDDKQANLDTLEFLINDIDFQQDININVMSADNGNDALSLAMKNKIALIILDIQMPQMDGFEVATYLQKTSKTKDMPIIFLTAAYKSEDMRKRGLHLGAVDYLLKPIDSLIIIPKIKHYIDFYVVTNKLIDINKGLEEKIKDEVDKNQEKDRLLFQQSKMASMGEMIGNIAHQWRQPISIISMWANNIIMDIDMEEIDDDSLRKYASNINQQTKHLSQTIDDFRNFFSPNKEKKSFTIQSSIDRTMTLLSASFKTHNIEVIENIEDIEILALENELTQAVLNIINNAKDILITLPKESKRLIFITVYKEDKNIIIDIKDNAGGVPENIIDKIFEPYFTTKHKSQGTGIGLYMTESIITKHLKGDLVVKNIDYRWEEKNYVGALFRINLPLELD